MKFLTTLISALYTLGLNAQTESDTYLQCDSVILINDTVELLKVQEIRRNKIIYFLCCDGCAVPREMKLNLIDTIIYSPDSKMKKLANEELIRLNYKLDTTIQSDTSNQIASSTVQKKNKYARQNLVNYSPQNLDLHLTMAKKTRKTGWLLTGLGVPSVLVGGYLRLAYGAFLWSPASNQSLATFGSIMFVGGSVATLIGVPTLTIGLIRVNRIKNVINNNSTSASLEFSPYSYYNNYNQENQTGLTIKLKF